MLPDLYFVDRLSKANFTHWFDYEMSSLQNYFSFFFTVLLINTTECIWDTWRTSIGEDLKILANKQGSIPLAKLICKWVSSNAELYSPVKKLEWLNRVEPLIGSLLKLWKGCKNQLWPLTVLRVVVIDDNFTTFSVLMDSFKGALNQYLVHSNSPIYSNSWMKPWFSFYIFYLSYYYYYLPIFLLSIIFIRFVLPNACIICVCLRPSPLIRLLCFYLLALHALYFTLLYHHLDGQFCQNTIFVLFLFSSLQTLPLSWLREITNNF